MERVLAADMSLQVGHQQGRGQTLARYVSHHHTKPAAPEVEIVEVVTADLTRLEAKAGVVERVQSRPVAWEQAGLNLGRDRELDGRALLARRALGKRSPLALELSNDLVRFCESKTVVIGIQKRRVPRAPEDGPWRSGEPHASFQPLPVSRLDVVSHERHPGRRANARAVEPSEIRLLQ